MEFLQFIGLLACIAGGIALILGLMHVLVTVYSSDADIEGLRLRIHALELTEIERRRRRR